MTVVRSTATIALAAAAGLALLAASPVPRISPQAGPPPDAPVYCSPVDLAVTPDGATLVLACSESDTVALVDLATGAVTAEVPVGRHPSAVTLDRAGRRAYVTGRDDDSLAVVDLASAAVISRMATGAAPQDVVLDPEERRAFTANAVSRDLSVIDLATGDETRRLRAGERPRELALSADGRLLAVANLLADPHPPDEPPVPQVTVVDLATTRVIERLPLPGANLVEGIAPLPDGSFLLPLLRPKNLVPLIQVAGGWTITNGIGLVTPRPVGPVDAAFAAVPPGTSHQLLLDSRNRHFADPSGIAVSADGRRAYVTSGGGDRVVVVDVEELRSTLRGASREEAPRLAERLDLSARYVLAALPTGPNPQAAALSPDGSRLYVADRLGDSVTVVDTAALQVVDTLDLGGALGGPEELTPVRRGARAFHSSGATFAGQFTCVSCHPDSAHDGLVYDISPDGLGRNFVDTKMLRGLPGTAPFKWSGLNPDLHTQCGPRAAKFINRSPGFTPQELDDLVAYEVSLLLEPNRAAPEHPANGGELDPLQEWGREIFERTVDSTGRTIPEFNRCTTCHPGPRGTGNRAFDVGTRSAHDDTGVFDTPGLNNLVDTGPYLHDGKALTLEELWTVYNPDDRHGRANDLSKEELNALVEYLKTL